MESNVKYLIGALVVSLAVGLRYVQYKKNIDDIKFNFNKINFDQSAPEPKLPMGGFRSWSSKELSNGQIYNTGAINLPNTFPFSQVEIYKNEIGAIVVNKVRI